MELKEMISDISKLGCESSQGELAERLYEEGQMQELIKCLKKCRCSLVDEMHESQRKVDRIDLIIRLAEKEAMK
ncbi:MAG: hypothetical protein IJ749_07650 [Eubacterium sp.]|nr:hypothetical protein [Eubacterium sp.]